MTPQQVTNMRKVMFGIFGPIAFMLPDSDVIAFRDEIQMQAATELSSDVPNAAPANALEAVRTVDRTGKRPCTCNGTCKGADGLGVNYYCSR